MKSSKNIAIFQIFFLSITANIKPTYEKSRNKTLLCAIIINMDKDENITSEQYNKYYRGNNAIEGIKEIIKNNQFYINDFPIPGTEREFQIKYPEGYLINQKEWLVYKDGKYQVNFMDSYDDYDDAAFATATGFIAGLEFRLYDTNDDNYVDIIEMDYVECFIVNEIIKNDDGTYNLFRSKIDNSMKLDNDGREYDADYFNDKWNEKIKEENYDSNIKSGDLALFFYKKEGWIIQKAKEVKGILTDGADHEYYQIGENKFQDAMRFSRDNIIISNRCGEYLNAHKYFGFFGYEQDFEVSLWFINTLDINRYGAPCGFSSGENAKYFLLSAINISRDKLESVIISEDGSEVEIGQKYVKREDYESFRNFISRAEMVSVFDVPNDIYDYNVYLLYLANYGSQDDIGAQFSGYKYQGFDNQINIKYNY